MFNETLERLFRDYGKIGQGDIVLDVGTGFGQSALTLARLVAPNGKVYTVDPSNFPVESVLSYVKGTELEKVIIGKVASAEKLPFEDNFFDKVVTVYSFHHFSNRREAIKEMARVCKEKGHILIIEWKPESKMHPHSAKDMPKKEEIIESIATSGFKIIIQDEDAERYIIVYKRLEE